MMSRRSHQNGNEGSIAGRCLALLIGGLLITFVGCRSTSGEEPAPNTLTEAEKEAGWELLFDGESLDGWMSWANRAPLRPGNWKAVDGSLALVKPGGGDIYTRRSFENFDLRLEWKSKGNSGIFLRVNPEVDGPIWHGAPEMQVLPIAGEGLNVVGSLYALYPATVKPKMIHPDGWNKVRIRMKNGHGTHWFNGHKLYEYQIGSDTWKKKVQDSKFADLENFAATARGHIGLQDHSNKIRFRNIKIKRLPNK